MELHQIRSTEILEMRSLFNRWIALLDIYARKITIRRKMHSQDYEALYSSLLNSCRFQADQHQGEHRIFFLEMANLIEPWFTIHTFETTKQKILINLLIQCREIEQILSGRKNLGFSLRKCVQFCLLTVVVCLGVLALNYVLKQEEGASSVVVESRMVYRQIMYYLRGTTFLQRFAACTVVMLIITAQFVRTSKKY